jgi:hypothetical protein
MKRRDFIKTTSLAAPMVSLFPAELSTITRKKVSGKIEKRSLGRTGELLSMIGFGGIVVKDATPEESSSLVKLALIILMSLRHMAMLKLSWDLHLNLTGRVSSWPAKQEKDPKQAPAQNLNNR